ncbi:endo-beta-1,6-galactanase [Coniochaeta ligniaria NRRL 30616]|uniref:Endo-beta-1,6-galactanase n=1 Tax=Coniochaeta ligniaria NRRL 30616 TaxID=1408157 RepID=A0A1J7J132_9PEZI|nr:endo-beta-1,6-galactanase [Coniochaeta ligniaria NRRL 30616]
MLAAAAALAAADTTTTISPSTNWGTWDGWGTSLAWWAKEFGTRDDLADIFFSTKTTSFNGTSVPGLGLTVVRYNAGACSWNSINGESMVVSPKMIASRQVEGYWTDWNSSDPSSASWKWSADANQRAMLAKAKARGANRFELFSNSPMWWMCKNHNPSGADDGSDNLQSWNLNQHAVYLATIAKYAKDNWGITFNTVEPFNEPISSWWNGKSGTQEGCHFDVSTQAAVIPALRTELNNRGLCSTVVAASDENTYDLAVSTFNGLGSTAISAMGQVNVHGYQQGSGRRDTLYSLASGNGKKLWNTEYGESDATGGELASNLILDFRWLHPTAWVYWQVLDGGGWGLIDADNDAGSVGAVSQKYFVLAQFTRHIRPGMSILDGGADNVVAAYDAAGQKLVVVAVNWGEGQYLNFDLSKFSKPSVSGAKVLRWQTKIGSGDRYAAYSDTAVSGTKFWSWFDTDTVQTFEVPNVVL